MADTDPYLVVGIQAGRDGDKLPIRREIDEWWFSSDVNDLNQHSLFIYGLTALQERGLKSDSSNQDKDLSFFGLGAIHGLPIQPWPLQGGPKEGNKSAPFYCAHGKQTFGTWHVPYMLLYEQRIYQEMKELIPKIYDESIWNEMNAAADTWRLPFWDWALKKPTWNPANPEDPVNQKPDIGPNVPFLVTQPNVEVRGPAGLKTVMRNPMFQFPLAQGTNFGDYNVTDKQSSWIGKCRVTSRWPSTVNEKDKDFVSNYVEGKNQDYKIVTKQLQGVVTNKDKTYFANNLPDAVYRLMRSTDDGGEPAMPYQYFVTSRWITKELPNYYPSLEGIHNNIHNFSGGGGYLGSPATSAFDPLFWLHHCNVDRLLAIWQTLYPNAYQKWLDAGNQVDSNGNPIDGPETELTPFRGADGQFFTSKTASLRFKDFNYTYPELQDWNFSDREEYVNSINATLDRLYSTTSKAALLLKKNNNASRVQMSAMTATNLAVEFFPRVLAEQANIQPTAPSAPQVPFGNPEPTSWTNKDYVANVVYEKFALDGESYSITFFLGAVPGSKMYIFGEDETAISRVYNFASRAEQLGFDETGCANCKTQQAARELSSGQIILTDYLIERLYADRTDNEWSLTSLERDEVVPYLRQHLHWRISDFDGNVIPKEDPRMAALKISVAMAEATHFSDPTRFSQYTPYEVLYDVTDGRLAGASQDDL